MSMSAEMTRTAGLPIVLLGAVLGVAGCSGSRAVEGVEGTIHPSTQAVVADIPESPLGEVGPGQCLPGNEILNILQQIPSKEDFKPPYGSGERTAVTGAVAAWYGQNLGKPCVKATAAAVKVSPSDLPNFILEDTTLTELSKPMIIDNTYFKDGKIVPWEKQKLPRHELVFAFKDETLSFDGLKLACGNLVSLPPKKEATPETPSPTSASPTTAPSTPRKFSPSTTQTPTPKPSKPSLAPKNPTEAGPSVKPSPASDNKGEAAKPAEQPQDSGNGFPSGVTPRANPSVARESVVPTQTHIGTGPTMLPQTEKPAPAPIGPTQSGLITAPGP